MCLIPSIVFVSKAWYTIEFKILELWAESHRQEVRQYWQYWYDDGFDISMGFVDINKNIEKCQIYPLINNSLLFWNKYTISTYSSSALV